MEKYSLGFDIGSEFVHAGAISHERELIFAPKSLMHFGNPSPLVERLYKQFACCETISEKEIAVSFTGSGGKVLAEAAGSPYFYDTLTIPAGADFLDSKARYVLHIGAKEPYFFEKALTDIDGRPYLYVPDHSTGTKCGGGSGILITKQCRRFFEKEVPACEDLQKRIEAMYHLAYQNVLKADKEIHVGGRCGVVIQSDMIHLQNTGESLPNILKGMFECIAKNYQSDVLRVRSLDKNAYGIATGGVCSNEYFVQMLEKYAGISVKRPLHFEKVGALGAALKRYEIQGHNSFNIQGLEKIIESERENIRYAPPLSSILHHVRDYGRHTHRESYGDLNIFNKIPEEKISVVLGVDGGSTTTKAMVVTIPSLEILAEICIETHGKPLESAQRIFKQIDSALGKRMDVKAVGYTGSAGPFYYKLFTKQMNSKPCADVLVDEITCHALGVRYYNKNVDTIFELGGQDAKFTVFTQANNGENSTVKKSKMNLSCMAGTGQTIDNMRKMLGLSREEFEEHAFKARRVPLVDDTCGVFTESAIAKLISLGLPKEEIAAAIAYSCLGGYINKFVGSETFGQCISAQGGPFNSKACLAALALHTNQEINAFPHRQLFGALGAALKAYQNTQNNGEH